MVISSSAQLPGRAMFAEIIDILGCFRLNNTCLFDSDAWLFYST